MTVLCALLSFTYILGEQREEFNIRLEVGLTEVESRQQHPNRLWALEGDQEGEP